MGTSFGPFIYTSERSIDVLRETDLFLQDNLYSNKIKQLAWAYHSIGEVIPHTQENLFSGHYFPWAESWDELQVSFSLCRFGLYKQAMVSLRGGLELGLLSVYWNLNDDGHVIIKQWLKSREDTPRFSVIWKRLEKHSNFKDFQRSYDIRQRLLDLGYLHDYVHSKGYKHSNRFGIMLKPNFQSFDEGSFKTWYEGFREVIEVLCILHLIKYPIGIVKYDYDQKFGMDKPSFGGLETFQVEQVEEVIGDEVFKALEMLTQYDNTTKGILEWLNSLPDITEDEIEEQMINWDKFMIEQQGFEDWLKNENSNIELIEKATDEQFVETETRKRRISLLKDWASENGFMQSALERYRKEM